MSGEKVARGGRWNVPNGEVQRQCDRRALALMTDAMGDMSPRVRAGTERCKLVAVCAGLEQG